MKKIVFVLLAALLAGLSAFAVNDELWTETAARVESTSALTHAVEGLGEMGQNLSTVIDYTKDLDVSDLDVFGSGSVISGVETAEVLNPGTEYYFDPYVYPYRALLSEPQQAVYNQIYANAVVVNDTFALVAEITPDQLAETMAALLNDHAELFWLDTAYSFNYYMDGGAVSSVTLSYYDLVNNLGEAQYAFETAAQEIINGAYNYGTDIEKEWFIHDAIGARTAYDESAPMNQSAYSALVNGRSVCAGYSRAFQYLCQRMGITVYYVTGTADGSNHAWNLVNMAGEYYNVDVSWDDTVSEAYGTNVYTYFNLSDEVISQDHTRSALSSALPECWSYTYTYTNIFGSTPQISDIKG